MLAIGPDLMPGQLHFHILQALVLHLIFPGLIRLALDGGDLPLNLNGDIVDTQKIIFRIFEFIERLSLLGFILCDARRLIKKHAPVFGARADDKVNFSLLDQRVSLSTDTGPHQQFLDIPKAHNVFIKKIFAFSRAK